jgi:hypothetical protein
MGRFLFTCAIATWLGTVVSFSYVFLPAIHALIEGPPARHLLQRLFRHYYLIGIVCGLIALATVALAPPTPSLPTYERIGLALPVAFALLCALATREFLLPRMGNIFAEKEPETYARMHRYAAMLNTTMLALLVLVVAALSTSR